jgi:hypothetical protein
MKLGDYDLNELSTSYSQYLIGVLQKLFTNRLTGDLGENFKDVIPEETIPAVQYCNTTSLKNIINYNREFITFLEKDKTYLNVGSGINFLEYQARAEGFNIECTDIKETFLVFDYFREYIKTPLNFGCGLFGDELVLHQPEFKRYDYIMFLRYVPFEFNSDYEQVHRFITSCKKYSDHLIVSIVRSSYAEWGNYIDWAGDKVNVFHKEDCGNTANYFIKL